MQLELIPAPPPSRVVVADPMPIADAGRDACGFCAIAGDEYEHIHDGYHRQRARSA